MYFLPAYSTMKSPNPEPSSDDRYTEKPANRIRYAIANSKKVGQNDSPFKRSSLPTKLLSDLNSLRYFASSAISPMCRSTPPLRKYLLSGFFNGPKIGCTGVSGKTLSVSHEPNRVWIKPIE